MLFLFRVLIFGAVLAGLAYGALFVLGLWVEPEQREITQILPRPASRPAP